MAVIYQIRERYDLAYVSDETEQQAISDIERVIGRLQITLKKLKSGQSLEEIFNEALQDSVIYLLVWDWTFPDPTTNYSQIEGEGVYFASKHPSRAIKIGYTKNLRKRMSEIGRGVGGSYAMTVYGFLRSPAAREYERLLHDYFAFCRLEGEWFKPGPVLEYLKFVKRTRDSAEDQS